MNIIFIFLKIFYCFLDATVLLSVVLAVVVVVVELLLVAVVVVFKAFLEVGATFVVVLAATLI